MHTTRDKKKLVARVRRIRGQLEAVERAIEEEQGCAVVMNTVAAARGALGGLAAELVQDHLRFHVIDPRERLPSKRREAVDELIQVVRAYLK